MKLSTLEKIILRIIAQDGDYERLDLLLNELKEHLPGSSDEKVLEVARQTLREFISNGLVELYCRKRTEADTYGPLSRADYAAALDLRDNWLGLADSAVEIGVAPTSEGQKIYELNCDITK